MLTEVPGGYTMSWYAHCKVWYILTPITFATLLYVLFEVELETKNSRISLTGKIVTFLLYS